MHWTESRFWKTLALLAVMGLFSLAWALGAHRDLPIVQPAPADDILALPLSSIPRLQVLTTTDNGATMIWWHFKKDSVETIELVETKTFRLR